MDPPNTGNMNSLYGRQYSNDDLQRLAQVNSQNNMMGMMGQGNLDGSGMPGGQSLDEIINQNHKEMQRRRSYQQLQYGGSRTVQDVDPRRSSMMEFVSEGNTDLEGFQFDPPVGNGSNNSPHDLPRGSIAQRRLETRRRESGDNLALDTQFSNMAPGLNNLTQSPAYQQSLDPSDSLNLDVAGTFLPQNLGMSMDFSGNNLHQDVSGNVTSMNIFSQANYAPGITTSAMRQDLPAAAHPQHQDPGGGSSANREEQDMMDKMPNMQMSDRMQDMTPSAGQSNTSNRKGSTIQAMSQQPDNVNNETSAIPNPNSFSTADPISNTLAPKSNIPQYRNAYSSSGFDMLGVLMRVATRPKPQINIGAVDMSCAFVVCDVTQHDIPIVYCSDIFERLTGYTRHEILGRNCRFLQAPDGKVQSGVKRKYVDDQAVLHLKNMTTQRQEAQISLINYRKGGQPFMNLLTMIPITYDSNEIKYYVGFQVDLVEQPTSITNKNPGKNINDLSVITIADLLTDGSYAINYQRGLLPTYVFNTPENNIHRDMDLGQTIGRDEVSTVLSTIGTGESELSKRIWDKVLLENTDDVVHVLSLKGLFLYLSPSSRKVLEYDPHELVGTALSSVCHPSDIVPVTRELKDTSTGAAVNVVFRIRRKHSGYTWFESHGSLHTEQGKGKKCIILVGRQRPVYALAHSDIVNAGGIGESELWTKMSTSGMFLFVSSNVRILLDRQQDEVVGTSAQALMRSESKLEFGRMLELARTGRRVTFKHEVFNKRGQTLHAQTTIYPGDATEGHKPTFLVGQTRFLKMSRGTPTNVKPSIFSPSRVDEKAPVPGAGSESPGTNVSGGTQPSPQSTPQSSTSTAQQINTVVTQPGGNSLPIGNQHEALASEDNLFDELKTTRSTSWQFELRQMEKRNRLLAEELQSLLSNKKKRKRRKGAGQLQKDCANCHTRSTPEWRRGPSGNRDLCNSCGLRWAKQVSININNYNNDEAQIRATNVSSLVYNF